MKKVRDRVVLVILSSLWYSEDSWLRLFARFLLTFLVLAQIYSIRMASELKSSIGYLVYHYNGTHSQASGNSTMDVLQRKLQCCGAQNYTDWLKETAASWRLPAEKAYVPESCCKEEYFHCTGDLGHLEQFFQEGCLKNVLELLAGVSNGILMTRETFYNLRFLEVFFQKY
uniref:Uncharacterized protein n=1 Tax=Accipiter nisus TaxID=211598 RepID=A0A8B9MRJ8_9AVES